MSNPFSTIEMLIDKNYRVPLAKPISFQDDWQPVTRAENTVELGELLYEIKVQYVGLEKTNKDLKEDLLWCILNSGQLYWSRDIKRELLEKYFPEEIKKQPFYNGGD